MSPTRASLAILALSLAIPAVAAAQPSAAPARGGYYAQPQPVSYGGFHDRAGTPLIGFGLGLGGMRYDDADVRCPSCDYEPLGVGIDFHVGGMLSERFGLMLELQGNAKTVEHTSRGTTSLSQGAAMIAGQYWLSPQLWIKGGLGVAHLSYEYDDYYGRLGTSPIDDGAIVMGAIGYEILSARTFAIDLQGRVTSAVYDGIDQKISTATIGLGLSWYGLGFGIGGGAAVVIR